MPNNVKGDICEEVLRYHWGFAMCLARSILVNFNVSLTVKELYYGMGNKRK